MKALQQWLEKIDAWVTGKIGQFYAVYQILRICKILGLVP